MLSSSCLEEPRKNPLLVFGKGRGKVIILKEAQGIPIAKAHSTRERQYQSLVSTWGPPVFLFHLRGENAKKHLQRSQPRAQAHKILTFNYKMLECPHPTFTTIQQGSRVLTVVWNWDSHKTQTLAKGKSLGHHQDSREGRRQGCWRDLMPLTPTATASIKHSMPLSWINLKPGTTDLFASFCLTWYIMSTCQFTRNFKRKKKQSEETKTEASAPGSDTTQIFELPK